MARTYYACSALSLLHIVGKKWTIPIIETLSSNRKMQFNSIQLLLGNITSKNLSKSLKELTDSGIISKVEFKKNNILHTEYSLTRNGILLMGFIQEYKGLGMHNHNNGKAYLDRKCIGCSLFLVFAIILSIFLPFYISLTQYAL